MTGPGYAGGPPAAFFDVDETLITVPSIFRFLAHCYEVAGLPRWRYEHDARRLRGLGAAGAPRSDVLAAYTRLFTGRDAAATAKLGEDWFRAELRRGDLFHPPVLAAFHRHADAGHRTVLVSGSLPACAAPIARFLGADQLISSAPELAAGRYTGELSVAMVGPAKADAVRREAEASGVDLDSSFAYGDHHSDLPVLSLVGNPVVVGNNSVLLDHAGRHGWTCLPGVVVRTPRAADRFLTGAAA